MAFPTSPVNGQLYNGYQWDGESWKLYFTNPSLLGNIPSTIKDMALGNDGVNSGAVVSEGGLSFSVDDQVTVPYSAEIDIQGMSLTITREYWIKFLSFTSDENVLKRDDWNYGDGFKPDEPLRVHINYGDEIYYQDHNFIPNINTWYHIAIVYNGYETIHTYINGVLHTDYITNTAINRPLSNGDLSFVSPNNDLIISDVRIWNVARTQQEIQDNMNRVLTGNESGLVAYYPIVGLYPFTT